MTPFKHLLSQDHTIVVVLLVTIFWSATLTNAALNLGSACQQDSDCGLNAICWYYPVSPGCSMGTCSCKAKYYAHPSNPIDCYQRTMLSLNMPCKKDPLEQYPRGAYCYAGVVKCQVQYDLIMDNTGNYSCQFKKSVQSDYGLPCISDAQCNPEIGLYCSLALQSCVCYGQYIWLGNGCEEAYYGSSCVTDDNCQTGGAYAQGGPGHGGICAATDHTCTCDSGFSTVNFTQFYLDNTGETQDMIQDTWTICVVSQLNTVNQDVGQTCTVPTWSSGTQTSGQSYCRAGLACIICPEQQGQRTSLSYTLIGNSTSNQNSRITGTCRNSGFSNFRSNFSVALMLSCIYFIAYVAKMMAVIIGL